MTPTEMHIDALMEKIEDLELKISLMIDPIVFNSMSAEYADHLSRLSDQNKKLEAENARYREALERIVVPDPVFYDGQMAWLFKMIAREALKGE